MVRKVPCQYCKSRRRKCERANEFDSCARCIRMGKKCIPQDIDTSSYSSSDDLDSNPGVANEQQYKFMQQQVTLLEREIQQLEIAIANQETLSRNEPQWDISVTNGEVILHSEIKTVQEFLLYRQSALRYLSPFSGTFYRNSLIFKRVEPSLVSKIANLATRLQSIGRNSIDHLPNSSLVPRNYLNATSHFIHSSSMIDALVGSYFKCVNVSFPVIHEITFRQHYRNCKKDPLKQPLIAAICCSAAGNTCRHSLFNALERRYISEYFYNIAINLLIDIFDDPNHALEALVSINLLYRFMGLTLRIDELRKWSTIASLIANSLKKEMLPFESVKNEHPKLRIKSAITQRNSLIADAVMNIVEFVAFNKRDSIKPIHVTLDILPDETGVVRDFMETINYVLVLLDNPIITKILSQTRNLVIGNEVEFTFEELMRYEEVLLKWWHDLPDERKLTKEPFNCTTDLIKNCTDIKKLSLCAYIYGLTLGMQSCLINPKLQGPTQNITNIVRERAVGLVIYSSEILLVIAKQASLLPGFCLSPLVHLVRVFDSLIMVIHSFDKRAAELAKSVLSKCMSEIDESISPDHHVSSIISPIYADNHTAGSSTMSESDLYFKYPMPAAALLYDVLQNTVNKL
ncbi:hypothetical protein K501DRAFT_287007 [Backusella circina FSU 941]|nr:hypothetical protein K501DRAFT_287007 [Backusella circina FSU 941]